MTARRRPVLGLIPARAGSKGVPRKNLAPLAGRPLIAWTIEAALASPSLGRVIVSTDSEEIARTALALGADVPFMRPASLAADDTTGPAVVIHALEWLDNHDRSVPDYVMMLQPTSPLRTAEDIEAAVTIARERRADSVISVSPSREHPLWTKRIRDNGTLDDYIPGGNRYMRRQDLPPAYALNGAIYLVRPAVVRQSGSFYAERTYPYVMAGDRSLDIDTIEDMRLAELLIRQRAGAQPASTRDL